MAKYICPKCGKLLIVLPVSITSKPLEGATGSIHIEQVEVCKDCETEKYRECLSKLSELGGN